MRMTEASEPVARWTIGTSSARFDVAASGLKSPAGRSIDRWIDTWAADDPTSTVIGDVWRVSLPFARWADVGTPPGEDAEPEQIDSFQAQHSAMGRLVGITAQDLSVETVGHIGASDVSFLVSVDGHRLSEAPTPTPFARDGSGQIRPLLPCVFVAFDRIARFNARGKTTRTEQLYFVSELRDHLDRSAALLGDAEAAFTFQLDPHLQQFRAHRATDVALAWKPQKNGRVFDLQLEQVAADGTRAPIDLDKLDAESPLIALSATEHVLLDPDVEAVARVAKSNRNKLKKHAERHFSNPATLLPEGVSLDKIDLSAYGPRVVGFAPIVKAERFIDIRSSGTQWYQQDGDTSEPFIRLEIAQAHGIESIEISTPEAAEQAVARLEAALETASPETVAVGDRQVQPTPALVQRLQEDLSAFRARGGVAAEGKDPAGASQRSGRVAAVIAEDSSPVAAAVAEPDAPVPWDVLETLLAEGRSLKPHQREGLAWLWTHYRRGQPGVLLADDMGLGKTLQLAAFLALQRAVEPRRERSPSLIVCPVILLKNWENELTSFFRPPVFASLQVLYADTLRRLKNGATLDLASIHGFDYVLTNYETLQAHQQSLLTIDWNVVVLDEAHAIKNSDTYRARAARGLKRSFGICSTGTPVENRLSDLWGLYDFLSPGDPFSTLKSFEKDYEADLELGVPAVRSALRYPRIESSLLRRTKSEVLDLPPKTAVVHAVPMTPRQLEHERSITKHGPIFKILQGLQRLYQHPRLLVPEHERSTGASTQQLLDESPKLALAMTILDDIRQRGEKALVFTLWTAMQDLLVEVIRARLGLRQVRVINGDPGQRRHALRYIDEFSRSDGFDVLVLSPLAAGTGLTITAANHVIHYGRWWNPAKEDQATDRAYRIGQTRPVHVHYPLLHHPGKQDMGFDMKLHGLVEGKRGMAKDFLAPQPDELVTMDDMTKLGATDDV